MARSMVGRRSVLAVIAAVAVGAAGVGWLAGQRIKSPAEVAAETAAPEPSLITVPVELRELSSRVIVRGTVESSGSTSISVSGTVEGVPVVTRLPLSVGDPLAEGEVAIEVAGRPVIVLQGELPEFRSLGPGVEGPDVNQLETALTRLGYDVGTVDDRYTVTTGEAVQQLYSDLGYRADEPSADEVGQIKGLEDQIDQIQDQIGAASGGGGSGLPQSQLLLLDQAITHANEGVADAKAAKSDGLAEMAAARDAARTARGAAVDALGTARARLVQAEGGTHPDTGVAPTDSELTVLADAVSAAEGVASEAEAQLSAAESAYSRGATGFDRVIRDAEVQVEVARLSKSEAISAASEGEGGGGPSVADLREDLAEAQQALSDLRASVGVRLPVAEFRFVKTLPSVVQSVDIELGQVAGGTVLTVAGASTVLESSVSEADRRLLEVGMEGVADDEDLGLVVPVRITKIADQAGGGEGASDRYRMELTPLEEVPDDAIFRSLRVTIPVSSTGGEVLAVPLAAVSAGADGSSRVEVANGAGVTKLVEVVTGLSAEGFVEIRPSGGDLEAGDRVVVGRDLLLPGRDEDDGAGEGNDGEDGGDALAPSGGHR